VAGFLAGMPRFTAAAGQNAAGFPQGRKSGKRIFFSQRQQYIQQISEKGGRPQPSSFFACCVFSSSMGEASSPGGSGGLSCWRRSLSYSNIPSRTAALMRKYSTHKMMIHSKRFHPKSSMATFLSPSDGIPIGLAFRVVTRRRPRWGRDWVWSGPLPGLQPYGLVRPARCFFGCAGFSGCKGEDGSWSGGARRATAWGGRARLAGFFGCAGFSGCKGEGGSWSGGARRATAWGGRARLAGFL
jgi:hypothetical protein